MIRTLVTTTLASVTAGALLLGLTACGEDSTAGTDAVAIGGTFEFVSPGGQTEITYDEADRQTIGDLQGDSLMDPGTTISLSDFEGQVVILNAWGQWCGPCRSESDDLQIVQEKLEADGRGTVLGINVRDSVREKAQDFVTDNGLTFPSIYDPPFKSALALGGIPASVIPTTIVLDKQHRPAKVFLREVTADDLWAAVEPLLNE
ncbi:TlpA family protein disulfide reductase [Corynebacterium terpenotabidum]|uniref:Thiol-disulfide isomerase/thioredoxin n=1 Tax=Corynebacterium terpenotabidum Y-11 TaxID=1200352 RepID=S4XIS8_9CORY|nr:TlpA disulfide reductase family protein [Corynebacterium terpenotabidum]AGP31655.1 thiol-disulfide isomerase/thioredoxin [Corynebacterium terpenotabidum Y-11]